MADTQVYEISFITDDPALVEEALAGIPRDGSDEAQIAPGLVARSKDLRSTPGLVGSEILLIIGYKVIEGVATKLLIDLVLALSKKYGARLRINGSPVAAEAEALAARLEQTGSA